MSTFQMILDYLIAALALGVTFLYGSVGEILIEKVGHLNLGIPGVMCMGAAGGCMILNEFAQSDVSPVVIVLSSILGSFAISALMGAIYSLLTVTLKANQNVAGLALTTFGVGLMKFIMSKMTNGAYLFAKPYFRFPFASQTNSLVYCGVMMYLAIVIAVVASFILSKTKTGLHLRAVGENPATADAVGINVNGYKYIVTCIGCGISGLGGLFYVIDYGGSQEAYLSVESLGWLSIALVIFALWKPVVSIIGSAVFGALFVAGSYIPGMPGVKVSMASTPLLKMLPYVVTIIVLVVISARKKKEHQPPQSLGLTYFREER